MSLKRRRPAQTDDGGQVGGALVLPPPTCSPILFGSKNDDTYTGSCHIAINSCSHCDNSGIISENRTLCPEYDPAR